MRRHWPVLVGLFVLVLVGCTDPDPQVAPPSGTTTVADTTTTVAPTTSTSGRPTTTTIRRTTTTTQVAIGPGEASIGGTVSGPAGPVDGATVRVERLIGKAVATADVTTAGGGSWQLPAILGGSYRVRAFKPPDLGQSAVESFFLAATERKTLDLKLPGVAGEQITALVNPNPPRVDQPAVLTIRMGASRVDDQGRPVLAPRAGLTLALTPAPGILLESAPFMLTDANGAASWRIRCAVEGAAGATLTIGTGSTPVRIPACAAPGPTPTTTTRPA